MKALAIWVTFNMGGSHNVRQPSLGSWAHRHAKLHAELLLCMASGTRKCNIQQLSLQAGPQSIRALTHLYASAALWHVHMMHTPRQSRDCLQPPENVSSVCMHGLVLQDIAGTALQRYIQLYSITAVQPPGIYRWASAWRIPPLNSFCINTCILACTCMGGLLSF